MTAKMPDPVGFLHQCRKKPSNKALTWAKDQPHLKAKGYFTYGLITTTQAEAYAQARVEEALALQAKAAIRGMDAAKALASTLHSEAQRIRAESNPDALASERQANAILTAEVERLEQSRVTYFSDGYEAGWNAAMAEAAIAIDGNDMTSRHAVKTIRTLKRKQS